MTDNKSIAIQKLKKYMDSNALEFFDLITDGWWCLNIEGGKPDWDDEYLSPKFKAVFGYEDHELKNSSESWKELIHPEDAKRSIDALITHIQDDTLYRLTVRYKHKKGHWVWIICRGHVTDDGDGNPSFMIGTHTDITSYRDEYSEALDLIDKFAATVDRMNTSLER